MVRLETLPRAALSAERRGLRVRLARLWRRYLDACEETYLPDDRCVAEFRGGEAAVVLGPVVGPQGLRSY